MDAHQKAGSRCNSCGTLNGVRRGPEWYHSKWWLNTWATLTVGCLVLVPQYLFYVLISGDWTGDDLPYGDPGTGWKILGAWLVPALLCYVIGGLPQWISDWRQGRTWTG